MFRQRTTHNIVINVGLQWFNRILGVVSKVVLARLLLSGDFGVFAIATGLVGFVGTFWAFGLDFAIIQNGEKASDEDYNVGMTLRLAVAVGLFAVSLFAAGPRASLFPKFGGLEVTSTTQVVALVYLVTRLVVRADDAADAGAPVPRLGDPEPPGPDRERGDPDRPRPRGLQRVVPRVRARPLPGRVHGGLRGHPGRSVPLPTPSRGRAPARRVLAPPDRRVPPGAPDYEHR